MTPTTSLWRLRASAIVSLGLLLTACAGASRTVTRSAPTRRCLLLTTNDSEANFDGRKLSREPIRYLDPVPRIAAEKARLLAEHPGGVLLVAAGDILQGRYMVRTDGDRKKAARQALRMYEAAGFDLATLGNHEFDAGPATVAHALVGLKTLQFLNANLATNAGRALDNSGERLFKRAVVRDCGGIKVGFFGLLTPSARTISDLGDTRFANPSRPITPASRAAVAALRKQGAEAIVAISHLGLRRDKTLAGRVGEIDAIVGAHTHTLMGRPWRPKGADGPVVVQAGSRFSHLGYLELVAGPDGIDRKRFAWRLRWLDDKMPSDPAQVARLRTLRRDFAPERQIGTRTTTWDLGRGRRVYGRLVARALRRHARAKGHAVDGVIINSGGLRTRDRYPPGPVTDLEVRAIHPFANRLVIGEMSGHTLRDLAEHACMRSHRGRGLRVILAGLTIVCDSDKPAIKYTLARGHQTGIAHHGQRARVHIGGKLLDEAATYRIATNNYLARGGSGFFAFTQSKRSCLDGTDFTIDACASSPTLADVVQAAVTAGTFER